LNSEQKEKLPPDDRGQHLAFEISMALSNAMKLVRGLWKGLTETERKAIAQKVARLKEHGDQWKLDEEMPLDPLYGAHSSPPDFTKCHQHKKD
jgi:hypothetical protein